MPLMPEQSQTQIVLHGPCHINMEDFHLYSFTPSLKLHVLLLGIQLGLRKEGLSLPHTTSRASSLPALLTTGLAQDRSSAAPPSLQLILCLLLAERGLHFDQEGFSSEPPALTVIFLCHTLKTDAGQLSLWRAGSPQVEGPVFVHSHKTSISRSLGL